MFEKYVQVVEETMGRWKYDICSKKKRGR
jgi:hypothetical protein